MITTVIFDLDDTLYDEQDFVRSGFRAASKHLAPLTNGRSVDDVYATMWDCFVTGESGSTFDLTLETLGIPDDPDVIDGLVKIYRTHTPMLTLPSESRRILDRLAGRYTLGLLTDGYMPTQRLKVKALGIETYFKAIMYTEELGRKHWKPSPLGFQRLMKTLEARPEQTVYVADNETKDFIAPNRLGMLTIQLLRPSGFYRKPSDLADAAPKVRIEAIEDVATVLADDGPS